MARWSRNDIRRTGAATAGDQSYVNTGGHYGDVYLAGSAPVAQSAYREQVEQIFPWDLVDREYELAELAAFCTGEHKAAYAWWQGPPWAGKSALMATFVLHPPPGVRVVSFFVTARYAGQSDWQAFLDVVMEQLAELLHQPMPALLLESTRTAWFARLLKDAALACRQAGERLVLLVDGLDEDRGASGSGAQSIAALLPAAPPYGMRIIVAGRPDPPVPANVPAHHPLRDRGVIRALSPSAEAQIVRDDAERELDELLSGDTAAHRLLGLLVAAGGGLSSRDLAELTGMTVSSVDKRLRAVSGRTFSSRDSHWQPRDGAKVFVLAHEELQKTAAATLGEAALDGHRRDLHAWADGYRERGWPAGTPEYLLRGYHRLLQEASDLPRMVAHATDQTRLDRMLDISGGDATALAEVLTCQAVIRAQPEPDLYAVLTLARIRERLAGRNAYIPSQLPAVWAELGNPTRGEALARGITNPERQTRALVGLMKVLAATKRHEHALLAAEHARSAAEALTNADSQIKYLISLSEHLTGAGYHDQALDVARDVEERIGAQAAASRWSTPARLVDARIATGRLDDAELTAESIGAPDPRILAYADLIRALVAAGRHDAAQRTAAKATAVARTVRGEEGMAPAFIALARALTAADQPKAAGELLEGAEADAERRFADEFPETLVELIKIYAEVGLGGRASAVADRAGRKRQDGGQLSALVSALAEAGLFRPAEAMLTMILPEEGEPAADARNKAFLAMAGGLSKAGKFWEAAAFVHRITHEETRSLARSRQAMALAMAGELAEAEGMVRRMSAPGDRVNTLAVLVIATQASGDSEHARRLARQADTEAESIGDPHAQVGARMNLLAALTKAGHQDHAREVAHGVEAVARSITHPGIEMQTHLELIAALAASGQNERIGLVAGQAMSVARTVPESQERSHALVGLADQLAAVGHLDLAVEAAVAVPLPEVRHHAFARLTAELLAAGALDRAGSLAEDIADPRVRAGVLISLLEKLAGGEDGERAAAVAANAESAVGSIVDLDAQTRALARLVSVLGGAGHWSRAESAARSVDDPYAQSQALAALTTALIAADRLPDARNTARTIPAPEVQTRALTETVKGLAAAGLLDEAEEMIRDIPDLETAIEGLWAIARADPSRARRLIAWASARVRPGLLLETVARIEPSVLARLATQDRA